jgi:hypothetical protein
MLDAIKPLLNSDLINEETRQEISEAWEAKLNETREQLRVELREEFAQRYEHDKTVMVEALDKMVTDSLQSEITQLAAEKQALAEDRVKFQQRIKESAEKFDTFMVSKLAEELRELRADRRNHQTAIGKLEEFVVRALGNEIREFQQDKKDVIETKVRLMSEARAKLESLKAKFVKESSNKLSQAVSTHLKSELHQLKEDIQIAKQNNFGRRIFEAYAAEFGATYLNESAEIRKLNQLLNDKNMQLKKAIGLAESAKVTVKKKEQEIRIIRESNERQAQLDELLMPLNQEKRQVMRELLESVQTTRLKTAFEKYLPAVLENRTTKSPKVINESVSAVTGDKSARAVIDNDRESNVIEIKRLAGL